MSKATFIQKNYLTIRRLIPVSYTHLDVYKRQLTPIEGLRGLSFQLGARTVSIDASEQTILQALAAIREAGFDPKPIASSDASAIMEDPVARGLWRLGLALSLAVASELLEFLAPEPGLLLSLIPVSLCIRDRGSARHY